MTVSEKNSLITSLAATAIAPWEGGTGFHIPGLWDCVLGQLITTARSIKGVVDVSRPCFFLKWTFARGMLFNCVFWLVLDLVLPNCWLEAIRMKERPSIKHIDATILRHVMAFEFFFKKKIGFLFSKLLGVYKKNSTTKLLQGLPNGGPLAQVIPANRHVAFLFCAPTRLPFPARHLVSPRAGPTPPWWPTHLLECLAEC